MHERHQQKGVRAGPYKQVLVGDVGGLRAPRVDHHHAAAALLNGFQAVLDIRRRHQRALRHHGVAAHAHEEIGVVDIGNGKHPAVAVEQFTAQVFRLLVDGAGGEEALGIEQGDEHLRVDLGAEVVAVGIAVVHGDGVLAILVADMRQVVCAVSASASSQPISCHLPSTFLTGLVSRSGSS